MSIATLVYQRLNTGKTPKGRRRDELSMAAGLQGVPILGPHVPLKDAKKNGG